LLGPVSTVFLVQALVVTLQMGALGLPSKRKSKVKGIGAKAGQPLLHVYVPSTVNEAAASPDVGVTVIAAVSASTTWAKKATARQASASAGPSRRAQSLPLAIRTFGTNSGARRSGSSRLTHT
jgi:hypothetical protein